MNLCFAIYYIKRFEMFRLSTSYKTDIFFTNFLSFEVSLTMKSS